ncbi:MAG: DUF3168 domain-containing protein [Hyphomicrobiales bacterium]
MSFFTVPLAEAVTLALVTANICEKRVFSYVPQGVAKPYVLIGDFNNRTDHAALVYGAHEQFTIKIFDDAETLKGSLDIRQEISEILVNEAFGVVGATQLIMTIVAENAGFNRDGEGSVTMTRFNALLHKEN